jgi:hypothetical protein
MEKIPATLYLNKVKINRQGYESNGRYWGIGASLYRYDIDPEAGFPFADGSLYGELRASSRVEARKALEKKFFQLKLKYPRRIVKTWDGEKHAG